ncbi:calmodulin-dependent protein kinase [Gigaspora margarita]|uniref:Calmodulin-dependent protein kinase n=1 Tax=Gigaspora margarita TaxID=4874 RepID=A0A8H4A8Q5_GIGMA|nr:calmodulin-dependent protein kinase [Gigaspora margarita]
MSEDDLRRDCNNQLTKQSDMNISLSDNVAKITAFNQIDLNNSDRIFWFGYCYEHGIDVEKDEHKAFDYYQQSANMNNSEGMYQVGHCYYLGIGVKMDKYKAFEYYQKSANEGNSNGIYKTAICYYFKIGVKEDYKKYKYWIEK